MNDRDRLRAVLAATGPVLLDFDGPVTPILATGLNRQAADRMRAVLAATGTPVPEPVRTTPDPMEVLRFAGNQADEATIDEVEATLRRCDAARSTPPRYPTPHPAPPTSCPPAGRRIAPSWS